MRGKTHAVKCVVRNFYWILFLRRKIFEFLPRKGKKGWRGFQFVSNSVESTFEQLFVSSSQHVQNGITITAWQRPTSRMVFEIMVVFLQRCMRHKTNAARRTPRGILDIYNTVQLYQIEIFGKLWQQFLRMVLLKKLFKNFPIFLYLFLVNFNKLQEFMIFSM